MPDLTSPAWRALEQWARPYRISRWELLRAVEEEGVETAYFLRVSWFFAVRTLRPKTCAVCRGARIVPCPSCGGTHRRTCESCGGGGRVWSPRSKRMIQCRTCRASGGRRCYCRDGRSLCSACKGVGQVEEWAETVEERPASVAERGEASLAAGPPERAWTGASLAAAPADLRSWIEAWGLATPPARPDARLAKVSIEGFSGEVTRYRLALAGATTHLAIPAGERRLVAPSGADLPFRRRLHRAAAGAIVGGGAAAVLALAYALRHPFFAGSANTAGLALLAPVLALAFAALLAVASLPRRALTPRTGALATLPLLLVLLAQWALAATGAPSVLHAQRLREEGKEKEAMREAAAAADLGIDRAEAEELHDRILWAQAAMTRSAGGAWQATTLPFRTVAARQRAEERAALLTAAEAGALQRKGAYAASFQVLAAVPEAQRQILPVGELLADYHRHELAEPLRRVRSRAPLAARLAACEELLPHARALETYARPGEAPKPAELDVERLTEICADLRSAALREEVRQRRAEEQAAERARRRETAKAEAASRSWARAPLLCRDGSESPSCVCGGSHRGCCSHHGGVAGCSADR